ncbi:MAG: hypothetical protein AYL31_001030 [Candidatus Bathyarchaeota archaeon B26-1]|nr:MAG: hypothetical protein AYL31_001030 [Candidatus Bathyarchaeota archaeon B26-1]
MDLAALVTGGKDSALALYRVLKAGHRVKYLVTIIPRRPDSWMFHYPNIRLAGLFAEAVGIPHVKEETEGVKERELEDLKRALESLDVEGVVSGAVASEYQKNRIEHVCRSLGLRSITPLWHEDPVKIMEELISLNFQVLVVGVYAYGLDRSWLGRRIDREAIRELVELSGKLGISVVGEGGEYETLVLDAPYFRKKIEIVDSKVVWDGQSGYLEVEKAELIDKP